MLPLHMKIDAFVSNEVIVAARILSCVFYICMDVKHTSTKRATQSEKFPGDSGVQSPFSCPSLNFFVVSSACVSPTLLATLCP